MRDFYELLNFNIGLYSIKRLYKREFNIK